MNLNKSTNWIEKNSLNAFELFDMSTKFRENSTIYNQTIDMSYKKLLFLKCSFDFSSIEANVENEKIFSNSLNSWKIKRYNNVLFKIF